MNPIFTVVAIILNLSAITALSISLRRTSNRLNYQIHENRNLREINDNLINQSIEQQKLLNGGRNPGSYCIGCKHLIVYEGALSSSSLRAYNCRKNLRCKEYEEAPNVQ